MAARRRARAGYRDMIPERRGVGPRETFTMTPAEHDRVLASLRIANATEDVWEDIAERYGVERLTIHHADTSLPDFTARRALETAGAE